MGECRQCRFWEIFPADDADYGFCRRYAPRPLSLPVPAAIDLQKRDLTFLLGCQVVWPQTSRDDSCGEYAPEITGG